MQRLLHISEKARYRDEYQERTFFLSFNFTEAGVLTGVTCHARCITSDLAATLKSTCALASTLLAIAAKIGPTDGGRHIDVVAAQIPAQGFVAFILQRAKAAALECGPEIARTYQGEPA